MKRKTYSLQIRKTLAVLLHLIFLTLTVSSISFMYLHTRIGSGLGWILERQYEDTPQFQQQFQSDLDLIFKYVSYRDIFETDGSLDLSKEMFAVSHGDGPEITYTLEEVLRYAKSQGFYLNDQFEVVNDLFIYDNVSTTRDQRVIWRAYEPNPILTEPGDAYSSLLDLSREVLDCLSDYYTATYRFMANPSNLYYSIAYLDGDTPDALYTNASGITPEELMELGRYCSLTSESIIIDTNLSEIPKNIATSMEQNNTSNSDRYYITVAVDTDYLADDLYSDQSIAYRHLRSRFAESLLGLALGIIGCLATLYYLVINSGYRTADKAIPYLHGFDGISTEACLIMTGVSTLFALFLGEKIGYRLIHLVTAEASWSFLERMLRAVLIYGCCMISAFSLLRRYKCRTLWSGSTACQLKKNLELYFTDRSFSWRLLCVYSGFIGAHLLLLGLMAAAFHFRIYAAAKAALLLLLAGLCILDYLVFHKLFCISGQHDRIADAIAKIAGGDTSYQMDLQGLSGKELQMGKMINSIGTGLEQALQEQVKSERLKADLITNVSHDIKTPLTSIINYVDLLKREKLPGEKVQEYLNVLDQKSQRLKNLTEDLVEASKASSGNVKLEMATLDLVEMIWQTNGEFEEKFQARNLTQIMNFPEEDAIVRVDGRRMWRVLANIYNNAAKYAMEGTRIYADLQTLDGKVIFSLKNISEQPLNISSADELTERFIRGDLSRSTEGSGLGLSIAKTLTTMMGGTFDLYLDGDLFKVVIIFNKVS